MKRRYPVGLGVATGLTLISAYYNLLPGLYGLANAWGLFGWGIFMVFDWVRERGASREQARLFAEELNKMQQDGEKRKRELDSKDARRKELRAELRSHYQGVITRLRQFPDFETTGLSPQVYVPSYLEKDKMHLEAFPGVWRLCVDRPTLRSESVSLDKAATKLVYDLIEKQDQSLGPLQNDKTSLIPFFTEAVISYMDAKTTGRNTHDFQADEQSSTIDGQHIEGDHDKRTKVASMLNAIMERQDAKLAVKNRREAFNNLWNNKGDLDKLLRETVIDPCDNGNWTAFEKGMCGDCKDRKEELISLGA